MYFEFRYYQGIGFRLCDLLCEFKTHMRNGRWGDKWKKILESYPNGAITLDSKLVYCNKCKKCDSIS